jgi:hypothetical protein
MRKEDAKRLKNLMRQDEFVMDEKELLRASCDHMIDGHSALENLGGNRGKCKLCKRIVDFSNLPSMEVLDESINKLTTAIDLIKLGNDDLDDEVRQELGRLMVHQQAIKRLYKKTRKETSDRPRKSMYPGMPGADMGMNSYLFRAFSGGYGGGQMLDDRDVFGNNNFKKKKKKNKHKYFNEYD